MKKFILIVISTILLAQVSFAQTSSTSTGFIGFRRSLATVMFAGLGGAVLGLSTLSFYGEPQEHIGNIWTGLAIGALGGTAYVVVQSQRNVTMSGHEALMPPQAVAFSKVPVFQYAWEF